MTLDWRTFTEPQSRFDQLRARAWRVGGTRFADLGYANAWDGPGDRFREALHRAVDSDESLALQYTPYGGTTVARRIVAQSLAAASEVPYRFRNIVLTPGAMSALSIVFRYLGERGGNLIILTPTWIDHPLYAATHGLTPRLVPLRERHFTIDHDAIRAAIDHETRAIVLTQPGNPTGTLHSAESLRELGAIAREHNLLVVSDECHRDYVFGNDAFEPAARWIEPTITTYSYGKRFLAQGQRLGYAAVSPALGAELGEELALRARILGIATPTALMQKALPDLDQLGPDRVSIGARRNNLVDKLRRSGVEIATGPATMFVYAKAPHGDDWGATEALAESGVLVCPAALFHSRGWVRLSASASDSMVDDALESIGRVLGTGDREIADEARSQHA